jgi:hypothetical protein
MGYHRQPPKQPPFQHERADAERMVAQMLAVLPLDVCFRLIGHAQDVLREHVAQISSARGEPFTGTRSHDASRDREATHDE